MIQPPFASHGRWFYRFSAASIRRNILLGVGLLLGSAAVVGASRIGVQQPPQAHNAVIQGASDAANELASISQPQSWKQPQREWLYVLDSNAMATESHILLVDPKRGRVVTSLTAGYNPDMALSVDGHYLYVASSRLRDTPEGPRLRGSLDVLDTQRGKILRSVQNPDQPQPTHWEYQSLMAFSQDGTLLHMFKHNDGKTADTYYVATLDTGRQSFLPGRVLLPGCLNSLLFPLARAGSVEVVCTGSRDVRLLDTTAIGTAAVKRVALGPRSNTPGDYVGMGFVAGDGHTFTAMMGDGRFLSFDSVTGEVVARGSVDSEGKRDAGVPTEGNHDWLSGSWIRLQIPSASPDGQKLYIGLSRLAHVRQGVRSFDRIAVVDAGSLNLLATITPSQPCWSFTLSKDGSRLYATSPEQASVMVIDSSTGREIRTIYGVGRTPIWATVAP
jgi:YVTN family beta-propeller protein